MNRKTFLDPIIPSILSFNSLSIPYVFLPYIYELYNLGFQS
ncbi:hypothetical protein LEP1GSC061_1851 [Leptospira wolffii serovar Khorat str. Khorat-H2]|nr:hypothetical protein LEP1GSC061_1851 [Leptospira wolffii serovar Khorat str. Khorat-H2]